MGFIVYVLTLGTYSTTSSAAVDNKDFEQTIQKSVTPSMKCTPELAIEWAKGFNRAPGCPSIPWFQLLQVADPNPSKLIINIGANKGWNIVTFLNLWGARRAPSRNVWKSA